MTNSAQIDQLENVTIVGGGPVGMMAALVLQQRGIEAVILEAGADEVRSEWRGSTIHPPTLEILAEIGLEKPVLSGAVKLDQMVYRDLELTGIARFDYSLLADLTRYPHRMQFEQYKLVRLLKRALEERGVRTLYAHRLVHLDQDDAGVTLSVETPDGNRSFRTGWLVAADGSHSAARKILAVPFPGFTYPNQSLIVALALPFEEYVEDLTPVSYWNGPRGRLSLIRTPDIWRIALSTQTPADEEFLWGPGDAPHADFVAGLDLLLDGRVDPTSVPLRQHQLYRSHQRLAERFRVGRVLLAGDAAHLSSTTGGMGLNSGIHDAYALANAFAEPDIEGALDRYATGRREVAEKVIQPHTTSSRRGTDILDEQERRARLDDLMRLAADPATAREHLIDSSMLKVAGLTPGLR